MFGSKTASLIAASALLALAAATSAQAGSGQKDETAGRTPAVQNTAAGEVQPSQLRWNTIAAEGQRFVQQRKRSERIPNDTRRSFITMAMAARQDR